MPVGHSDGGDKKHGHALQLHLASGPQRITGGQQSFWTDKTCTYMASSSAQTPRANPPGIGARPRGGAPGRNRTDVDALIWRVLSPGYKAGALTNVSSRGVIVLNNHAGIRMSSLG